MNNIKWILKISPEAINFINIVASYIYYQFYNPQASNKFKKCIYQKILLLLNFPYIGAQYYNNQDRFMVYKKYLIFYEIQEKEKIIIVKRIIHSKQNQDDNWLY